VLGQHKCLLFGGGDYVAALAPVDFAALHSRLLNHRPASLLYDVMSVNGWEILDN
jgi:hypothetical protein